MKKEIPTIGTDQRVTLTGDVFIVPNTFQSVDDIAKMYDDNYDGSMDSIKDNFALTQLEHFKKLYELNGDKFTEENMKDPIAQVWITIPDVTENLSDHGCCVLSSDGKPVSLSVNKGGYIPLRFLGSFQEGEHITLTMRGNVMSSVDDKVSRSEVEVDLNLTLNQKGYRYRRFGTFDEVVRKLGGVI